MYSFSRHPYLRGHSISNCVLGYDSVLLAGTVTAAEVGLAAPGTRQRHMVNQPAIRKVLRNILVHARVYVQEVVHPAGEGAKMRHSSQDAEACFKLAAPSAWPRGKLANMVRLLLDLLHQYRHSAVDPTTRRPKTISVQVITITHLSCLHGVQSALVLAHSPSAARATLAIRPPTNLFKPSPWVRSMDADATL